MSAELTTYSKFYYGYVIDNTNYQINFKEGAPELLAELNAGSYTFETFADEIARALNDAGALTYTVTANRSTRTLTIAAGSTFQLLTSSGSNVGSSPWTLMGFTGADRTGTNTYTGNGTAGSEYIPQFYLQSYVSSDDWQQTLDPAINKTASGRVEVVSYGVESFVQFQIKFATDIAQGGNGPIRSNSTGVDDLRDFMQFVITRGPIEFMPNLNSPSTFQTLIHDSSADSNTGTAYKLKELYDRSLPGYFETAILKFRLDE